MIKVQVTLQVLPLIFVGTVVCTCLAFECEETDILCGNPTVWPCQPHANTVF